MNKSKMSIFTVLVLLAVICVCVLLYACHSSHIDHINNEMPETLPYVNETIKQPEFPLVDVNGAKTTYTLSIFNRMYDINGVVKITVDNSLIFDEHIFCDITGSKRLSVNIKQNCSLENFKDSLNSSEFGEYIEDNSLTGVTNSGYHYSGFYRDREAAKGELWRRYMFYVNISEDLAVVVEGRFRIDINEEYYLSDIIIPALCSIEYIEGE